MDCRHLLPYFYLLRFAEKCGESVLNELLGTVVLLLRSSHENQQEAERLHFFKQLGSLLAVIPGELFDNNTINVLLHIKHSITEQKLLDQFVAQLLWRLLHSLAPLDLKLEVLQALRSCFTQNLIHFAAHLGFDQVLAYLYRSEMKQRTASCCEKHQRSLDAKQGFVESRQEHLSVGLLQLVELLFSSPKADLAV